MAKALLTDLTVSKIKYPEKPFRAEIWDTKTPAFGIRVSYNGTRTWVAMVRVLTSGEWKLKRIRIGTYPEMSLKDARLKAEALKIAAASGDDPRHQHLVNMANAEEDSRNSFGNVRDRFLSQHGNNLKKTSLRMYRQILLSDDFKSWEARPLKSITKREVVDRIDKIAERSPIQANRCLQVIKTVMNWAASRDIIDYSIADKIKKPTKERSRDRVLNDDEIRIAWEAFEQDKLFGPFFKILLLTGQRLNEVTSMAFDDLHDLDGENPTWVLARENTKNDIQHIVPLCPLAVQVIKSAPILSDNFVFSTTGYSTISGFSRAKKRIDKNIANILKEKNIRGVFVKPWCNHDLRRSCATGMAELGASRDLVELVLNHVSGERGGVCGTYNRSRLLPDRRRALTMWSDHIQSITDHSPTKLMRLSTSYVGRIS